MNAFEVATGLVVHGAHRSLMWIHVEYQWSMKGLWLRLFHTAILFHCSTLHRLEEWKQVASWSGPEKVRSVCAVVLSTALPTRRSAESCESLRTGLFASSLTVLGGIIMLLARDVYIKIHQVS